MSMRIVHPPPAPARAARAHLGRGQLMSALVVAALSAAFWGAASGSPGAGWMTLVSLLAHAGWSRRAHERFWSRAALSFLMGGTWAAVDLIVRCRVSR